jgi:ABC-type polysaccharide/polyol phosphate transport system ATPase subunit
MAEPMISMHDVHVDYFVQRYGFSSIKEYLVSLGSKQLLERKHILKGVDLEIAAGECFGIIGRNGSGKSTLLRVLSGIVSPVRGQVDIRGKVAPMLGLGVGLEPEMNGWENIRLCAMLMGLNRSQVKRSEDHVLSFSGLTPADLDMQVKRFSTGMTARLGFAIATANDPEILLIDEVLAVGDVAFQQKCYTRIDELKAKGSTIVLVSHFLSELAKVCDRGACIENGVVQKVGTIHEVGVHYHGILGIPV